MVNSKNKPVETSSQEGIRTLVATSLAHFINDGSLYVLIALYPKLLPSDYLLIGIIGAVQNTFSVVFSPIVGRKADSSRKYARLLSLGLGLLGVGIAGYAISIIFFHGFSLFLFILPFAIIAGIGSSFYHPIGAAEIGEKWSGKHKGRMLGINGSMGSLGRALYPFFTITLVVYLTIPSVGILAAVTFIGASLALSLLRGIDFAKRSHGNDSQLSTDGVKEIATRQSGADIISLRSIIPRILALTIIAFSRSLLSQGIVYFIPSYITEDLKVQYGFELGVMFSLMLGMAVIGQPIFGSIADSLGRRSTLGLSIVGSGVSILLFLNTNSILLASASLAAFGFFIFTGFPLLMPLATAAVPEGAGVMSGSLVWGFGTVGGTAVGPFLVGVLAEPYLLGSLSDSFYVLAIISLISLVLLPLVHTSKEKSNV